jgi:hypothetical protein
MINNGSYISTAKLTTGAEGSNFVPLNQSTGAVDTSPAEFTALSGFAIQPPPLTNSSGTYFFAKSELNFAYLSIPNNTDFSLGTGDFTIEWFQYLQNPNSFPRIFSLGSYNFGGITMAVSIENGLFYFWMNQIPQFGVAVSSVNVWTHFAIVRLAGTITVFMNGVPIAAPLFNNANLIDNINNLVIGNESRPIYDASFTGYLTNFRIIKGAAIYIVNFTVPKGPLTKVSGTVLLLNAINPNDITFDSSGKNKVINNTNVTWSGVSAFN